MCSSQLAQVMGEDVRAEDVADVAGETTLPCVPALTARDIGGEGVAVTEERRAGVAVT